MIIVIFLPIAASAETPTLATWNARIICDAFRTGGELEQIAEIMARYDGMPEPVRRPEAADTAQIRRSGYIRFSRVIAHPTDEESITLCNYSQPPIDISGREHATPSPI